MRITNKIIANNSLTNINNNKVYEDALNNQLATGCRISRPSDDPVVAIRALRLRTDLNQIEQYYKRNIPDADSWLEITEGAVDTTIEIIKDMYANCVKGAAGFETSEDRGKILENLKALQKEVYATADADYAGRHVFSGYRTNVPVTFGEAAQQQYTITEQVTKDSLDKITYVDIATLDGMTAANAQTTNTTTERQVDDYSVYRLRLAYDNCDAVLPNGTTLPDGTTLQDGTALTITYYDADGVQQQLNNVTVISAYDQTQDPYLSATGDNVVFIPETGELILGEDAYNTLVGTKDNKATAGVDEGEIRITYSKTNFESSDIRPEHFFNCTSDGIEYNEEYLTGDTSDAAQQYICYDVGYNQNVRVNTLASELFSPAIGRDVDDLIRSIEDVQAIEKTISMLKNELKDNPNDSKLQDCLAAAEKASTLLNDKMQKLFEKNITNMQNHQDKANAALTDVGNRSSRVKLVSNRLAKQKVNFEDLSSENEDIDLAEATIQLSSVQLAYQAALMATGKITQTTLLNFI